MPNDLDSRRARHSYVSSCLAQVDTPTLVALLRKRKEPPVLGRSELPQLGRTKVFVKTVPVTDLQCEHMYSTRNLYRLPAYYSYGVGSAGFGPFREVAFHIKTTNWVLEGAIENFPLMYHHRLLPRSGRSSPRPQIWTATSDTGAAAGTCGVT